MDELRLPIGATHAIGATLIRKAAQKCEGCGCRFTGHLHRLARDQGAMELDHKVSLNRGGINPIQNLQMLCLPCDDGKTNIEEQTGRMRNITDAEWRASGSPQDWTRKSRLMRARRRQ